MSGPRSPFETEWQRRFERFAASREDDAGIAGWSETGLALRFDYFRRQWRASPGGYWLDAGCGAGTYSRFLTEQGQKVLGLDYAQQTLLRARDRSPAVTRWLRADITRLPLRTEIFDGVISYGVIQALSASQPAVSELAARVRPGGEIWIDALNRRSVFFLAHWIRTRISGTPMLVRYESPGYLRDLVEKAGFDARIDWVPIAPARFRGLASAGLVNWAIQHVPGLGALLCHAFLVRGRRRTG